MRVPTGILDGYAVRWNEATIARDVVQNFFDEVQDFAEVTIDVDEGKGTVEVAGPSTFALDYLRYLGASTKQAPGRNAAGGFGEGFKICALVLLRDQGARVKAGSRGWSLEATLAPMKLGRELVYEVEESGERPGSFVRIEGARGKLCAAFRAVRDEFRWPGNERLKKAIFVDDARGVGIYEPAEARLADVFYRKQRRGRLRFPKRAGITVAVDRAIDGVEADRDRRDLRSLRPVLRHVLEALPDAELSKLLVRLGPYWAGGHPVLGLAAAEAGRRGVRIDLPARWLARAPRMPLGLDQYAEGRGFRVGCAALARLGMPTVVQHFTGFDRPRRPTALEHARFELVRRLYHELYRPDVQSLRSFCVVEGLEASLRAGEHGRLVVAHALDLSGSFHEGAPRLLQAMARAAATEASNADRLTHLLEGALATPERGQEYARTWDELAVNEGALLPPPPEDERARGPEDRRLHVAVLAPPGLPPAEALLERVRRLASERRIALAIRDEWVCGPKDARRWRVPGVPVLGIGKAYVTTSTKEGYVPVRPPNDEAILRVLLRQAALAEKDPLGGASSHFFGGPARLRARRPTAEDLEQERRYDLLRHTFGQAAHQVSLGALSDDLRRVASEVAWARLARGERDATLADRAVREGVDVAERIAEVRADAGLAFTAASLWWMSRGPHGSDLPPAEELGARARAWAPVLAEVERRLAAAQLDETCARTCLSHALAVGTPTGAAADAPAVMGRLDDAILVAQRRHGEVDDRGEPWPCHSLAGELKHRDGLRAEVRRERLRERIASAVRAAWDAELPRGEKAALMAALEAALPFDTSG